MNIFLIGKAGSGKSTIAKKLVDDFGYTYIRFAESLYDMAYKYFNMDKTVKDRKLLQIMGTEAGRQTVRENIWVDRVIENVKVVGKTAELLGYPQKNFVLDDCRFFNEFSALIENGWVGFHLNVTPEERKRRLEGRDGTARPELMNHPSETDMDTFSMLPYQIDANINADHIINQIMEILNEVHN